MTTTDQRPIDAEVAAPTPAPAGVLSAIHDAGRLAALESTGLLGGDGDDVLDRYARIAAAMLQAPTAFVSLVDATRQVMPGSAGPDPTRLARYVPLVDSFCQFSVMTGTPLIINDTSSDALLHQMLRYKIRQGGAYAGHPLITASGHVLGSLCVVDDKPRTWTPTNLDNLAELAALVLRELEYRMGVGRLVSAQGLASRVQESVQRLEDAVRSLATLGMEASDPRLQRFGALSGRRMEEVENLAGELALAAADPNPRQKAESREPVDLRRAVTRSVNGTIRATGSTAIRLIVTAPRLMPLRVRCDPLELDRAIGHAIVTTLYHSSLAQEEVEMVLGVEDDGISCHATLTITGAGSCIPTADLARIVSRFHALTLRSHEAVADGGSSAISLVAGSVTARSGQVTGAVTRQGTRIDVRWRVPRVPDGDDVIDIQDAGTPGSPSAT